MNKGMYGLGILIKEENKRKRMKEDISMRAGCVTA